MGEPMVSHGRGGAANFRPDDTPYTDGSIIREGPFGDQGGGAYSTGRGGLANIGSPGMKPISKQAQDEDVVAESAMREVRDGAGGSHHTGRGGEGNIHRHGGKGNEAAGKAKEKGKAVGEKLKEAVVGTK